MPTEHELQAELDRASGAYGKGMHEWEVGRMSAAELGQLQRRMKRAENKLRQFRYTGTRS